MPAAAAPVTVAIDRRRKRRNSSALARLSHRHIIRRASNPPRNLSQVFPEFPLVVELTKFLAVEIASRNAGDDLVPVYDGKMPKSAVPHEAQRVDCGLVGAHSDGVPSHDFRQRRCGRAFGLRKNGTDRIAPSEDADKMPRLVCN